MAKRLSIFLLALAGALSLALFASPGRASADEEEAKPPAPEGEHKDGDGKPDQPAAAAGDNKDGDKDGDGKPDHPAGAAADDKDGDGKPDQPAAGGPDSDGDGIPDAVEKLDVDGDGTPDAEEEFDEDDPPTDPFDSDGDGVVEPDEIEERKEFQAEFGDIPDDVDDSALEKRSEDAELRPSLTVEKFRKLVGIARKVVLEKMATKIAKKSDKRMRKFSYMVFGFSLLGVFLLAMPLALRKKYPGQGKVLFKYSALAAVTFFVTVNLFGGVLYGLRTAQGALSNYTNPAIAVARGTFDTLDKNAEFYIVTGKELFGPTLEQMNKHPDEQPAVLLLENGLKVAQDAKVFLSIAKMFKRVNFVFSVLPIILMIVTLVLFVLAIRPTLTEIVKLPAVAASGTGGSVGADVVKKSMHRVKGEMLATVCTVAVLSVITLVSAFVLGKVCEPALEALLFYFSEAINYLQFVEGASSGLVFAALFGVIFFLVLNLATLILSMSFFLGKSQKIFQARFNEGTPLAHHKRFFKWGIPAVLFVQLFPLLFVVVAQMILMKINGGILEGIEDAEAVSWKKLMLLGPLFLVVAYMVMFWAARGLKAIKFLATYKVKPKAPRA